MHSYKFMLRSNRVNWSRVLLGLFFLFFIPYSFAVVNVEGTRVVFNGGDSVAMVKLVNSGKLPSLVQIWTDEGDPLSEPKNSRTPIIALPPIFSIQPGEIKNVKLQLVSSDKISKDRESLYWLNIYQVPPRSKSDAAKQQVFLPIRFRLKVFVRPTNISHLEEDDGRKIKFSLDSNSGGGTLSVNNPTPWHMNINKMTIGGKSFEGVIINPYSTSSLTLGGQTKNARTIQYSIINDDGNYWVYDGQLAIPNSEY